MRTASVAFVLALAVAAGLVPLLRRFAVDRGLLDHAIAPRKVHGRAVPRLGGVAIVAGFFAPLLGLLLVPTGMGALFYADLPRALGLLVGGLAIALLGLYDDLRGAGAAKKLTVQVLVALGAWALGFRIEQLASPWGEPIALGVFALPFTLLWITGVVNALNLIDGLDGLAGGAALIALGTTFCIAFWRGDPILTLVSAALSGAVLGFLLYNFSPASIFMGDTGSMFLGFILAAGSIQTNAKSATTVAILVPVVALGLPIADTLLAIVRRAARGRSPFVADREHIHHRLLALGFSQRDAVIVLYATCAVLGTAALVLSFANSSQTAAVLSVLAVVGYFAAKRLGLLRLRTREATPATHELAARVQRLPQPPALAEDLAANDEGAQVLELRAPRAGP